MYISDIRYLLSPEFNMSGLMFAFPSQLMLSLQDAPGKGIWCLVLLLTLLTPCAIPLLPESPSSVAIEGDVPTAARVPGPWCAGLVAPRWSRCLLLLRPLDPLLPVDTTECPPAVSIGGGEAQSSSALAAVLALVTLLPLIWKSGCLPTRLLATGTSTPNPQDIYKS